MKTIAFYVTDLGFGHMTRTLALIEKFLKHSEHTIYLACGELQVEYAKVYLNQSLNRITFNTVHTEAGTSISDNSFEIDVKATIDKIRGFLEGLDKTVEAEVETLKNLDVGLIVSDISIVGVHVAKKLGIKSVGISNYTHYHRYLKLGIDPILVKPFIDAYNSFDEFFEYAYSDDMSDITCKKTQVGFVSREVNELACADFKSRYWPSAFLSIGQVANLDSIKISFQAGHIYATGSLDIEGNAHVIKLPKRVGHSQDYIAASSMAIIKPGWSQVAECMIAGIPFGVIDVNTIEDGEIIEKLKAENACFVLNEKNLHHLKIKKLNMIAAGSNTQKVPNDALNIVKLLIDLMSNS